jgi:formamidopyrimidine-DNA glycosylase
MPELPEVEITGRGIAPHVIGKKITRVVVRERRLRERIADNFVKKLQGQQVQSVVRRAKYLIIQLETGALLIHLGMSGTLRILHKDQPPRAHDHVDVHFMHGVILRFNDPRRFGLIQWCLDPMIHPRLSTLGVEPLTRAFNANYLLQYARHCRQPVKSMVMDQKCVVGVGNIYAQESLFYAGISPLQIANTITLAQWQRLVVEIKRILRQAIAKGGTTLKDFMHADGKPGYFRLVLAVYGREKEPCKQCQSLLKMCKIQGRTTCYCSRCQK